MTWIVVNLCQHQVTRYFLYCPMMIKQQLRHKLLRIKYILNRCASRIICAWSWSYDRPKKTQLTWARWPVEDSSRVRIVTDYPYSTTRYSICIRNKCAYANESWQSYMLIFCKRFLKKISDFRIHRLLLLDIKCIQTSPFCPGRGRCRIFRVVVYWLTKKHFSNPIKISLCQSLF